MINVSYYCALRHPCLFPVSNASCRWLRRSAECAQQARSSCRTVPCRLYHARCDALPPCFKARRVTRRGYERLTALYGHIPVRLQPHCICTPRHDVYLGGCSTVRVFRGLTASTGACHTPKRATRVVMAMWLWSAMATSGGLTPLGMGAS